jgi:hypothetical protein
MTPAASVPEFLSLLPADRRNHARWYAVIGAQRNDLPPYLMTAEADATLSRTLREGFSGGASRR